VNPARVLLISAAMGGGHDAAARGIAEAAGRLWPGCAVDRLDALDVMGPGVGFLFRAVYRGSVRRTPWLYQFFYDALWRFRWFAAASKRFIGSWCGRRLAGHLERLRPDVIVSTYPLGSAGLEWLRRHRGLPVPAAAWVCDFAPHPFWVYRDLNLNLVMHDLAVPVAACAEPGALIAPASPSVTGDFGPGDRAVARARHGLPRDGFVALVSGGSFGFGVGEDTVRELLAAGADVVAVVCGREDSLRDRLNRLADTRVRPLGWVDDMPSLVVAVDVVVTNAGGATCLEAFACGRPVLIHRPIAAHGRANTALMAAAGLVEECLEPGGLTRAAHRLRTDPAHAESVARRVLAYAREGTVEDGLRLLLRARAEPHVRALPAADALYLHIETAEVPQQMGAVLVFDAGPGPTRQDVAGLLAAIPGITGRFDRGSAWRGPRWVDASVEPASLVEEISETDGLDRVVDRFFGQPLEPARRTAEALFVRDAGMSALLVKIHHSLGDGVAFYRAVYAHLRGSRYTPRPATRQRAGPGVVRGLFTLATKGTAPRSPLDGPIPAATREHGLVTVPSADLASIASAMEARPHEILLAVFATALDRALRGTVSRRVRVIVPWSLRGTSSLRSNGNRTGAVSLDLPLGELSPRRRLAVVRERLRAQLASGVPAAAGFVVRVLGILPPWLHARAARAIYRAEWFNVIATVIPVPHRPLWMNGTRLRAVFPVLPLAPGVGLAWGAILGADTVTIGITGTPANAKVVEHLVAALPEVVAEFREAGS
jgi:UDP-N-acetylglucosamine:LPS N-acetylglucosamine transferase